MQNYSIIYSIFYTINYKHGYINKIPDYYEQ